jgi:anaerobic sulfite reductase subunit B
MVQNNEYVPFISEIKEVIKHTNIEYTFRMSYQGKVKPGQFFEVSIPKYGEAPISVSGIGENTVDLTIRRVGKVTNEVFEHYEGDKLFLRGPYGNGFKIEDYKRKEIVVIAGGTGVSPVRGVIDYFAENVEESKGMTLIAGFKNPKDILFREDFKRWKEKIDVILTVDSAEGDPNYQEGLVTKYIPELKMKNIDEAVAIVVGPPAMMRFSTKALLEAGFKEENIWISQERKMCCGIGKCGHCKMDDVYICLDGPVFNYTKGKNLID